MADKRQIHLVSYDIRDPKRWRRAYRLLRGYGTRIQYSVFRVHATAPHMARLRWEIEKVIDPEDALLVIRLCPNCAHQAGTVHETHQWPTDGGPFRIVG